MQLENEEFEEVEFPPRLPQCLDKEGASSVQRPGVPLNAQLLDTLFDGDGRLVDEHSLRHITFTGICPFVPHCMDLSLDTLYLSVAHNRQSQCHPLL